jgi:hypothetical protein
MGTAATINWSSTNATSCNVTAPNIVGWSGISGSESTGNLNMTPTYFKGSPTPPEIEYSVICSGPTGSVGSDVSIYLSLATSTTTTSASTPTPSPSSSSNQSTTSTSSTTTTLATPPAISITIDNSTNPPAYQLTPGGVGYDLAVFRFATQSIVDSVELTGLTINDTVSPAAALPSFIDLTLWNGTTKIGTAASPTPTPTGYAYTFNIVPQAILQGYSGDLLLKGDVASSANSTNNSTHIFGIANNTSITAVGSSSNLPAIITVANATGNPQMVVAASSTASQ